MATWSNRVVVEAPRNGTLTHTVDPAAGTVLLGSSFTPTAGRLLVVVAQGAVTSSTPTGWTLPTGGSAVNLSGLYVWHRTAVGADTFSTTHNGSNYPVAFEIHEYPVGSAFVSSVSATGVASAGGAGPTLSGLTGTNHTYFAVGMAGNLTGAVRTFTWSTGTEISDVGVVNAGTPATDGYALGVANLPDSVLTSASSAATLSPSNADTAERLVFAVSIGSGPPPQDEGTKNASAMHAMGRGF